MKLLSTVTALFAVAASDSLPSTYDGYYYKEQTTDYEPRYDLSKAVDSYRYGKKITTPGQCFGSKFEVWDQL